VLKLVVWTQVAPMRGRSWHCLCKHCTAAVPVYAGLEQACCFMHVWFLLLCWC
jgi:hypothetical protein